MNSKTILSLAIVAISSVAMADASAQNVESTSPLFSVTASVDPVNVAHSAPQTVGEVFTVPATVSHVRITGSITPTFNAAAPAKSDLVTSSSKYPQAALIAYDGKWYGWHCTEDDGSDGEWSEITGSTASEDDSSDVEVEFSSGSIKYTVGGGTATLTNPCVFTDITKLAFSGYGSYGAFTGLNVEKLTITVDLEDKDVAAIVGSGALNDVNDTASGGNGLTKWETLALGLESNSTKVYTAPVQASSGSLLGFKLGNAFTKNYGVSGASVTYKVQKCTTPNGTYVDATLKDEAGELIDDAADGDDTVYIDVPESGVEYYKIKITISNP